MQNPCSQKIPLVETKVNFGQLQRLQRADGNRFWREPSVYLHKDLKWVT